MKYTIRFFEVLILLACLSCVGSSRKTGPVQSGLEDYIRQARDLKKENNENQGSLWTMTSSLAAGFRDLKARQVADIVIIEVLESTSAVAEATTQSTKDSNIEGGAASLFGIEGKVAELSNLVDSTRSSEFSGEASTTRTSLLNTSITARVVEVFANGFLLLEGNREIVINDERQIVTVRGIVRPEDISPQNVVLSRNVSELEVEVKGRGLVSETQKPGALFKILSGLWPL